MKGHFFWTHRRGTSGPKYEGWFRKDEENIADYVAIFYPFRRVYRLFHVLDPRVYNFPETVRGSEEMKKYIETLLRLKRAI
jgi:hypothetical protein|nr:MAG TPA: glycoside hydrolase family protein [Caudoviricetes sp.]